MFCSPCTLGSALKTPLSRGISTSKPNLRLPQTIRRTSTKIPISLRSVHPFTAHAHHTRERQIPLNRFAVSVQRSYTTGSPTRVRKFGRLVLKFSLAGAIILICVAGANYWSLLHPAQLAKWPEELRRDLVQAGLAQEAGVAGGSVEPLTRAWRTIQNIPTDALNPEPSVKILSVAIWLSDVLERDHQSLKAYKVLTDAVDLHQARSRKSSDPEDAGGRRTPASALGSPAERRHLISVFLKLASLSESCEPTAEGKWLSSAIHEMLDLLPLCQAIPVQRFSAMVSAVQDLSIYDVSFSELSHELNTQPRISIDSSLEGEQAKPSSDPTISVEDVIGEEVGLPVPFPSWAIPDVASAIAVPFERIGVYAEKHARIDIAYPAYNLASDVLYAMTPALAPENVNLAYWASLVRIHRILNRKTDIQLRLLDSETHPTEWLYRLHEANRDSMSAEAVGTAVIQILNEKGTKEWAHVLQKIADPFLEYGVEMAISMRHKGIRLEKLGEMEEAMACFQNSLLLLRSGERPLEMQKAQECMKALQQDLMEGRTTLRSQMNPLALREWKAMEQERSRTPLSEKAQTSKGP